MVCRGGVEAAGQRFVVAFAKCVFVETINHTIEICIGKIFGRECHGNLNELIFIDFFNYYNFSILDRKLYFNYSLINSIMLSIIESFKPISQKKEIINKIIK